MQTKGYVAVTFSWHDSKTELLLWILCYVFLVYVLLSCPFLAVFGHLMGKGMTLVGDGLGFCHFPIMVSRVRCGICIDSQSMPSSLLSIWNWGVHLVHWFHGGLRMLGNYAGVSGILLAHP